MSDILERINQRKHEEVRQRQRQISLHDLLERARWQQQALPVRDFAARLGHCHPAVIAEIKKASPSKGIIRSDFEPVQIARDYEQAGAACLSVLTDRDFFQGHEDYLVAARAACSLPVLRKDFMVDPYQIVESRAIGADCILLIVASLGQGQLQELFATAQEQGLSVLIEVHQADELERALRLPGGILGINNRNLKTFEVSLQTTLDMLPLIPPGRQVVTESGISTPEDVMQMRQHGVDAFLVGETLMRASQPGQALQALFGDINQQNSHFCSRHS